MDLFLVESHSFLKFLVMYVAPSGIFQKTFLYSSRVPTSSKGVLWVGNPGRDKKGGREQLQ